MASVASVLGVVLYVAVVRTGIGQRLDLVAFEGRQGQAREIRSQADAVLRLVSHASLPVLGGAVVLVALARRRWRLGLVVGVAMVGTVVSAQILKAFLARPSLYVPDEIPFNSWPSGHASIAAALSLGGLLVVSHRWRTAAALVGAFFTSAFGVAAVVSGWHRPSDVLGAYLLATAWTAAAVAVLVMWRGSGRYTDEERADERADRLVFVYGAIALVVGFAAYSVLVLIDGGHRIGTVDRHAALVVALVIVVASASSMVALFLWLLRDVALDPSASGVESDAGQGRR